MWIDSIVWFIIWSCIGSFSAVVVMRWLANKSIWWRSECDSCHHQLSRYDMIPLFSRISLRWKCRYCHKKLPHTLWVSELIFWLLWVAAVMISGYNHFELSSLIALAVLLFSSAVLVRYDHQSQLVDLRIITVFLIATWVLYWLQIWAALPIEYMLSIYGFFGTIYLLSRLIVRLKTWKWWEWLWWGDMLILLWFPFVLQIFAWSNERSYIAWPGIGLVSALVALIVALIWKKDRLAFVPYLFVGLVVTIWLML